VELREYEATQSRDSVPSTGVAPLGLGDSPISTKVERVEAFERRREDERKGVQKVPEEQRREMLMKAGVPPTAIESEATVLAHINWSRIQSLASPTENPLPVSRAKRGRMHSTFFFLKANKQRAHTGGSTRTVSEVCGARRE
jgi:hypothetical protein